MNHDIEIEFDLGSACHHTLFFFITDPDGNTTSYTADVFNRPSVTIQPGTLATSYEYDLHGNLVSVLNAEGHDTVYTFDDMGRAVQETSPDSGTTAFTYDEAGDLRWKTDAKGIAVEYEYDELSRLTDIHYPAFGTQTAYSIAYTYDAFTADENYGIGRQIGMTDPSGSTSFKYNNRGRAFEKTSTIDGHPFTLSRTFTPAGRVSHMVSPSGRTMDFTLNACNCSTKKVETSYNSVTTVLSDNLDYRPFGQSKGMTRPNADNTDSTVANQYDLAGRTTVANPGAPKERSFAYDANGNLESVTSAGTPWYNRTFTYNALNQLTGATGPFGNGTIDYTYDDVYNRQTQIMSGITDTYNYASGTSRMSSVVSSWNDGITGAPKQTTVAYTHDVNGNTTAKGSRMFTYNQNNQLVKAEEGATVLGQYQYNGLGQRVKKTAGGVTTYFIYDFLDNLIAESNATGTIHTEYLYRGSARLAKVDISAGSAAIYYYMNDRLGTPEALIDENETVVWEAVYKPFGEADVHPASSIVNNLRLPGQYYDSETGLHYNYYRYYDPSIGRYLTSDPIGLDGGMNLYSYSNQNPVNYTDPYGLFVPALVNPYTIGLLTGAAIATSAYLQSHPEIANNIWQGIEGWFAAEGEESGDGETCPVDKDSPPIHPDFEPHKKKKDREKIPWDKKRKGFPDKYGDYWEPVPDGHKGTHDPHWDVQHKKGGHTPKYPPK